MQEKWYTPVYPSFAIYKWGLMGYTWECYRDTGTVLNWKMAVVDRHLYHAVPLSGPTQTGLYKHRRWIESGHIGFIM